MFAGKLALTLDTDFAPEASNRPAEGDLDLVTVQIIEQAGRIAGVAAPDATMVHEVLDRCAIDAPTNETGLAMCRDALMAQHGYRAGASPYAAGACESNSSRCGCGRSSTRSMGVCFHCGDLDEAAAMELMLGGGFQERGEGAGKWRRVQLTATQLSTYYVGYCEVRDLVSDLRTARLAWSDQHLHDEVLRYGSPPVRHIRTLTLP